MTPLVLVTRPSGAADPLVEVLRERGYRVAAVPTVLTGPAAPGGPVDDALARQSGWDWIVVTSAMGARAVGDALTRTGRKTLDGARWAAIGSATAAALDAIGVPVALIARDSSGMGIAAELGARWHLRGRRVLLARADAASPDLPMALRGAGAVVEDVVAYHTLEAPPESAVAVADALADEDLAAVVVASGSAVRGLMALASDAGLARRAVGIPAVSIGPSTTAVARDLGFVTIVEAERPSVEGLAAAVDSILPSPSTASGRPR
jgi:uroporphyrinogen-III synthase